MRCPKCKSVIDDDSVYCNFCGERLEKSNDNIEDYYKAYIGPKYNTLSTRQVNIAAILLGSYYYAYRKVWYLALIDIFLANIGLFFGNTFLIISVLIRLVIALNFNKLYLKKVKKDVEKIKEQNPTLSSIELLYTCRTKGGTSAAAPFICIAILFLFEIFISLFYTATKINTFENINEEFEYNNTDYIIGNLYYNIPDTFKQTVTENNHRVLINSSKDKTIDITTVISNMNSKEYLIRHNKYDKETNYQTKNLNNKVWDYYEIDINNIHHTYYAINYENIIYYIEINGDIDEEINKLIDSLNFDYPQFDYDYKDKNDDNRNNQNNYVNSL